MTRRDKKGRQQRHDVVMDLKHRTGYRTLPKSERPAPASLLEEAGQIWLQTLMNGIGPAKAFGCGLLLVRRA